MLNQQKSYTSRYGNSWRNCKVDYVQGNIATSLLNLLEMMKMIEPLRDEKREEIKQIRQQFNMSPSMKPDEECMGCTILSKFLLEIVL